jgi:hypothetical protein
VSAICDSRGSAGWQQAKIMPSRSSSASSASWKLSAVVAASSASLACPARARRSRSIALRRAVVASQPPQLAGTSPSRQCSMASMNASCTASAASPTSPIRAASAAVIRAASVR